LKALEWKYHLMCYACPFVVAFVYIFIATESRGKIYGSAVVRLSSQHEYPPGRKADCVSAMVLDLWRVGLSPYCNMLWPRMVRRSYFHTLTREVNRSIGSLLSPHSQFT